MDGRRTHGGDAAKMSDKSGAEAKRAAEIFTLHEASITTRTDRLFAILLPCEWLASIAVALRLSPYTWEGALRRVH
jgi:hypothetical protein